MVSLDEQGSSGQSERETQLTLSGLGSYITSLLVNIGTGALLKIMARQGSWKKNPPKGQP